MPRIYYHDADSNHHMVLYLLHSMAYAGFMALMWFENEHNAVLLSLIWTGLLAYHAYWHRPLLTGFQRRTYDRLRNQFGTDWDLHASPQQFDAERQKAEIEERLRRVLPDTSLVWLTVLGTWALLLFMRTGIVFRPEIFLSALVGQGLVVLCLQGYLRGRLREARRKVKNATPHDVPTRECISIEQLVKRGPRVGMSYGVGDDGELIEVRQNPG